MPFSKRATEGSSGLAEKYRATVRKARWTFPFPKAPDQIALALDIERNIDGNIDDSHIWLKPGNGWELGDKSGTISVALEGGVTDSRPEGTFIEFYADGEVKPDQAINKNTGFFRLWKSFLDLPNMPSQEEIQKPDRYAYEEKDALLWEGLVLEITEKEESGVIQKGDRKGEEWSRRQPLITAYLGREPSSEVPSAAPTAAVTSTNGNGAVTPEQAAAIAKEQPTFVKFLDALSSAGVDPGEDIAKPEFYTANHG